MIAALEMARQLREEDATSVYIHEGAERFGNTVRLERLRSAMLCVLLRLLVDDAKE